MSYTTTMDWIRDLLRLLAVAAICWLAAAFMDLQKNQAIETMFRNQVKYDLDQVRKDIQDLKDVQELMREIQLEDEGYRRSRRSGRR